MTPEMTSPFEPVVLCLLLSLIWAPLVYLAAIRIDRGRGPSSSELLWTAALCFAALPTLLAPALSASDLSLRPVQTLDAGAPSRTESAFEHGSATDDRSANDVATPPGGAPSSGRELRTPALVEAPARRAAAPFDFNFSAPIKAALILYVYGALLAFLAFFGRGVIFHRQVLRAEALDEPRLHAALAAFATRLGVKRDFSLKRSGAVSTVCVYGFFRPVILVPKDLGARLFFDDLVLMGAHELAHVKRGDQALYLAGAFARIIFWFNPFIRRIAARAELAAEQGADALVLKLGADRRRYAACFVEGLKFAAERSRGASLALPSFTPFDRQSRRDRLNAILTGDSVPKRRSLKALTALAAILAATLAFAQAGLAVTPEPKIGTAEPVLVDTREGKAMRAPFAGVVIEATDVFAGRPSLGKVVVIKSEGGRTARFAKMKSYSVRKGEKVSRGDVVGIAGKNVDVTITTGDARRVPKPPKPARIASAPSSPMSPLKPVAPLGPVIGPIEAPIPAPAEAPSPPEPPTPPLADELDAMLDGAPEAPPAAPQFGDKMFMAPGGGAYIFQNRDGEPEWTVKFADGSFLNSQGRALTEEDNKRFEKDVLRLMQKFAKSKKEGKDAANSARQSFSFHFDGAKLALLQREAAEDARAFAELVRKESRNLELSDRDVERIERLAERLAERAVRAAEKGAAHFSGDWFRDGSDGESCDDECRADAEAERAAALAEAEAEREAARLEAEAGRVEALAEAEAERAAARAEAEAEREAARLEAEMELQEAEEERRELEAEIRERAEALADAERDLQDEREALEKLRRELDEKTNQRRI